MPIIDVEIVSEATLADGLAQAVADAAGAVLGAPPGETWVRLRRIEPALYAESGGTPPDLEPVLVTIVMGRRPDGDRLPGIVTRLTGAVADATGRPAENVHLVFEPDGIGRVAFGGRLAH
jgi:phenylpyruvate tautomerase PptA (4-oxalocrotonate tautomerase family)